MQHQSVIEKPLLLKLSPVIIFPQTALQTENETFLGTLTPQIPFQGNMTEEEPLIRTSIKFPFLLEHAPHLIPTLLNVDVQRKNATLVETVGFHILF